MEVELVAIEWLKPHEEVRPRKVDELAEMTLRWDAYTKPLLIDRVSGAILDGHHRYTVGLRLGLLSLPAILVDYLEDDTIELDVWPDSAVESLTKIEIISMAESENVFPPKTSRHRLSDDLPPISVSLADLRSKI